MKILGVGETVLDRICLLQSYPSEGIKTDVVKTEYSLGGFVSPALILLSRLGGQCTLITTLGKDLSGKEIAKKLMKENIDLVPCFQSQTKTHMVLVNGDNGSRTIIKDKSTRDPIKDIPDKIIQEADLIVLDRHEPLIFKKIIRKKRPSSKIIFDPSVEVSKKVMKMLHQVEFVILPIESLIKICPKDDLGKKLRYLNKKFRKPIIITAGPLGSLVCQNGKIKIIPAYKIAAVDVLGAGDVFRAAFGYGVLKNWSLDRSVRYANLVAGLQCTKIGNGSAIPTKKEIEKFEKTAQQKQPLSIENFL
ncbi:carbohydrate kinase family protein [Candidatus Roizmanbacteria bacterium]|nr:carbohydrate kinase family protein [Candidatus Roizmanbacteria bacterium]